MPKQFSLDCMVDLPDDPFAAAELVAKLKMPWYTMLKNLQDAEVKFNHKQEVIETRAKPAGNGTRAPRRTKAQIAADKAAHGSAGTELGV
jgi:hypothetical protein